MNNYIFEGITKKGVHNMRCFECGTKNEYELKQITRKYEGNGYCFDLTVCVPFCKVCGAPLEDEETEAAIAQQANKKIREQQNIITVEEIQELLKKYNVSQKYLSKLLGWGEITLTRYINNGYTPNKQNSEKLKALHDPYVVKKIMLNKIEETNGEIEKENAFQKLNQSVNEQIAKIENNKGKIYQIVNWFLSQSEEDNYITHLALQKLLYFSQGWSYVFNNSSLFSDDCEAWVHGAVYRIIFDEFKKFKYHPLPQMNTQITLIPEEITLLEFVKKYYFNVYTAKTLEKICHLEKPFILARENVSPEKNSENKIQKEHIQTYYLEIAKKYNISLQNQENVKTYLNELLYSK